MLNELCLGQGLWRVLGQDDQEFEHLWRDVRFVAIHEQLTGVEVQRAGAEPESPTAAAGLCHRASRLFTGHESNANGPGPAPTQQI